ncbi:hypothetical protein [Taklimakanibacter lacteus]|uniref:hypothetical protein n=1 Tax=Taklimakanibacter lacteus TaxID=2268456 RepID=UPI000E665833
MSFGDLKTGVVIEYPFLWSIEAQRGETEGRKPRPAAVGVRIPRASGDILLLFPITTKQPEMDRFAVEVPDIEKRRAGLDPQARSWLILDEYNEDIIGQSFYLEPTPPLGQFSRAFFLPVIREFVARARYAKRISRR